MTWLDIHTHCLPAMDDGAKNEAMALQMLQSLKRQGVTKAALTPHFYPHKESLAVFLERRQRAWRMLSKRLDTIDHPELCLGAEVYIVHGISEQNLRPLCIENTDLLLLELPRQAYRPWILEELQNLTYTLDIIPVLAHIERYGAWYKKKDYDELFSFSEFVLQFNAESILNKKDRHFIYRLREKGFPLLIGSDAHNTSTRAPCFDSVSQLLEKQRRGRTLRAALQKNWETLHV